MFGNINEVVKVTEELLKELEADKMAVGKGSHDLYINFTLMIV